MSFHSITEIKDRCKEQGISFWKAIQLEDCNERAAAESDSLEQMKYMWQSMKDSVDAYEADLVSTSGLVGKEGGLMDAYRENEEPL